MNSTEHSMTDKLFEQWKNQHCELDKYCMELETWIYQQSQQRISQFREAVGKLHDLQQKLSTHFEQEQVLGKEIAVAQNRPLPEAQALQRQSERDHHNISKRLKQLIDRMQDAEFETDAWQSGTSELKLIIDVLEQHDEQEAESVGWLLPGDSCNR